MIFLVDFPLVFLSKKKGLGEKDLQDLHWEHDDLTKEIIQLDDRNREMVNRRERNRRKHQYGVLN